VSEVQFVKDGCLFPVTLQEFEMASTNLVVFSPPLQLELYLSIL